MRTFVLTVHVVLAIFLIGPIVAAANQAPRALRDGDAGALRVIARTLTIYGWASPAVGLVGFGLVQERYGNEFSDGWLIASIILFVGASAIVLARLAPWARRAAGGVTVPPGPVAALAGVTSLAYVVIAILMVWQPGN